MNDRLHNNFVPSVEALLFLYGEPMDVKRIASTLHIEFAQVEAALEALKNDFRSDARGLELVTHGGRYQLATKPAFGKLFETIIKEEFAEGLSPASLEALTIITYAGPITRAELDYVRGVNSSFIVRALMIRGLIERITDEKKGHAYLYGPTFELLKLLGVSRVSELPEYEHFNKILARMTASEGDSAARDMDITPSPTNHE